MPKYLAVDVAGRIVGSTEAASTRGLYRAYTSTGEDWGLVELKEFDWPRERVRKSDLVDLRVKTA